MSGYTKENADIPAQVVVVPVYDSSGAVTAAPCRFDWIRRIKNDSDAADKIEQGTKTVTIDLFDNVKTVNIPGVGVVTYRKIATGLKLVADAERLLVS